MFEAEPLTPELKLELFERAIADTGNGVVITDANATIVYVNPAFSTITGYRRDQIMGKNPRMLASGHQSGPFYQAMWLSLSQRGRWQGEIWNRRRNGETYREWLSLTVISDPDGAPAYYVGIFSDLSTLASRDSLLEHLAFHDSLTGLPNRMLLGNRLRHAIDVATRSGRGLSLLFLDLDGFKPVNDRLGHLAGDAVLRKIGARISEAVRKTDTVARVGGDEFVVMLPEAADLTTAHRVAAKVLVNIARGIDIHAEAVRIAASIGISRFPDDGKDAETLIDHADTAMLASKRVGGNRVMAFEEMPRTAPREEQT